MKSLKFLKEMGSDFFTDLNLRLLLIGLDMMKPSQDSRALAKKTVLKVMRFYLRSKWRNFGGDQNADQTMCLLIRKCGGSVQRKPSSISKTNF